MAEPLFSDTLCKACAIYKYHSTADTLLQFNIKKTVLKKKFWINKIAYMYEHLKLLQYPIYIQKFPSVQ